MSLNNKYTLITGATSGIGLSMAEVFAKNNYNIILSGRNEEKLRNIKRDLSRKYDIDVKIFAKDLGSSYGAKELYNEVVKKQLLVDILINNAGFGYVGQFVDENIDKDEEMIKLNIESVTFLTKLFAKEMVKRREGKILNVASTGAYHPGPYTAVYYATKAYVLSFSEAISYELSKYNIIVSTLCPGATKTNFAKNEGKKDNPKARNPQFVADKAYKGLMKGKRIIIPGIENKLLVMLPRKIAAPFIGRYQSGLKE